MSPHLNGNGGAGDQDERREELLAAARAVISERGMSGTTIADVARRASMGAGTVYTFFPTKSHLLAATLNRSGGWLLRYVRMAIDHDLASRVERSASERLGTLIHTFGLRILANRRLSAALLSEPLDPLVELERVASKRAYLSTYRRVLEDGIASGELEPQNTVLVSGALVAAVSEAFAGPLSPVEGQSPKNPGAEAQILDDVIRFVRLAVGADPEAEYRTYDGGPLSLQMPDLAAFQDSRPS